MGMILLLLKHIYKIIRRLDMKSKEKFIDKLMSMTEDDIQEYIKKNGKNNSNDQLFVFQWDNINPRKKTTNNK
jgi:uncharacterized spore protein YtfJ